MRISENLQLSEVIRSESAKRNQISNMPTLEHIENFKLLAEKIFEPIRKNFGVPIHISSGYRSKELNAKIGGSLPSQHCTGEAIDIDLDNSANVVNNNDVFNYIKDNLVFDQLIAEFPENGQLSWVHVSYESTGKQRNQILIATKNAGKTIYLPYKGNEKLVK